MITQELLDTLHAEMRNMREIEGGLRHLAGAFSTTGNSTAARNLFVFSADIEITRERIGRALSASLSEGVADAQRGVAHVFMALIQAGEQR